jgi:hypothetical protein
VGFVIISLGGGVKNEGSRSKLVNTETCVLASCKECGKPAPLKVAQYKMKISV